MEKIDEKIENYLVNEVLSYTGINKLCLKTNNIINKELDRLFEVLKKYNGQMKGEPDIFNNIRKKISTLVDDTEDAIMYIEDWLEDLSTTHGGGK